MHLLLGFTFYRNPGTQQVFVTNRCNVGACKINSPLLTHFLLSQPRDAGAPAICNAPCATFSWPVVCFARVLQFARA